MITDDVAALMAKLEAGFPNWKPPEATQEQYVEHLAPLPRDRAESGIAELLMRSTFPPSIGELLLACGIDSPEARGALSRAMAEKVELRRDFREPCGWHVDGEPDHMDKFPTPTRTQALSIGQALSSALPAGGMQKMLAGSRLALAPTRELVPLDDETIRRRTGDLHERAQEAIEVYERENARLAAVRRDLESERRAVAQMRAGVEGELRDGIVPGESLADHARAVLVRLAQQTDRAECIEVLCSALWPCLRVAEFRQQPDDENTTMVRIILRVQT